MKGFMRTFLGNTANGGGLPDGEGVEGGAGGGGYNRRLSDESFKTCLLPEDGSEYADNAVPAGAEAAEPGEDSEVSTAGMEANGRLEESEEAELMDKMAAALAAVSQLEQAYMTLQETVYVEKHCAQCPPECAVLRCQSCSCRVQLREFGNARDVFNDVCHAKGLVLELQQGRGVDAIAALRAESGKRIKKLERQLSMREKECSWKEKELEKEREKAGAVILKLKQDVEQLQEHLAQVQDERMAQVAKLNRTISQTREENERTREENERLALQVKGLELKTGEGNGNGRETAAAPAAAPAPAPVPVVVDSPSDGNLKLFEAAVVGVKQSLSLFTKQYMHTLKRAGLSVDIVANGLQPGILQPGMTFSKPAHVKFVFEAHISTTFFDGFEDEDYGLGGSAPPPDPDSSFAEYERLKCMSPSEFMEGTYDEGQFGSFCRAKFMELMSDELDEAFFGPDDQHLPLVHHGCHPESRFYENFVILASSVWMLHKLAFSFQTPARMFAVKSGHLVDLSFMESVTSEDDRDLSVGPRVGFMVIPGFRLGRTIFKSYVYLQWPKGR